MTHQNLKNIHKILLQFQKRAENKDTQVISDTFVDAEPLIDILEAPLNQIMFGRRGTGKTHALKYCMNSAIAKNDAAVYLDIRSIGSNNSFYGDETVSPPERGLRLVIDILQALHDELLSVALAKVGSALNPTEITNRIDDFANAITEVGITGTISETVEAVSSSSSGGKGSLKLGIERSSPSVSAELGVEAATTSSENILTSRQGAEVRHLDFGRCQIALSGLIDVLNVERMWLFLDEWSETPRAIQPYLSDLVRKTILPNSKIVVKIAAIEQRSSFISLRENGEYTGLELGADIAADLNLDEFLVFDYDDNKALAFFRELIFKNFIALGGDQSTARTATEFINLIFTQRPAFVEFVRAVEGVPRDALNLVSKCVTKSFGQKISVDDVRKAALDWYQQDKVNVVTSTTDLQRALNHIIDEIIGNRKARAFLFPSNHRNRVIDRLYDARVIHLLKKNISSKDEPGKRYDAWKIDYGCYVDLIRTQQAPSGLLPDGDDGFIDVPSDDYRSIRRAVLTPDELNNFLTSTD